jgi:hypothetical protein
MVHTVHNPQSTMAAPARPRMPEGMLKTLAFRDDDRPSTAVILVYPLLTK